MRCFVAAELPAERAAVLAVWAAGATDRDPALRLVAIDALHLTLSFIGSLPTDDVAAVGEVLRDAVRGGPWPRALGFGEPLWLSPRRPHVLTVAVSDDGALGALQERIARGLHSAIALPLEERAFLAHVTVARVRRGRAPRSYELPGPEAGAPFAPDSVTLMRSTLAPSGAQYESLLRVGHD